MYDCYLHAFMQTSMVIHPAVHVHKAPAPTEASALYSAFCYTSTNALTLIGAWPSCLQAILSLTEMARQQVHYVF